MANLSNHFLVASPNLHNYTFAKTVFYISDHDEELGAVGVVINKPIGKQLEKVFQGLNALDNKHLLTEKYLFWGGPMCTDSGYFLHNITTYGSPVFELTNNKNLLIEMLHNNDCDELFISLGYTAIQEIQLEEEIKNGNWLVVPALKDLIFDVDPMDRYEEALHLLGVKNFNQLLSSYEIGEHLLYT